MLTELHVESLGVIEDVTVILGPGMTALTGETGAGKTLLVDAISLLLGGPTDPALVRPGAGEAVVEGRFLDAAGDETILARVVPAGGRSRAYVDGRMASAGQLAEAGRSLVDLHGQHAHQSLLSGPAQRAVLDRFGGVNLEEMAEARRLVRELEAALEEMGGDARTRAREIDLIRFQLEELDSAGIVSETEDDDLRSEEERLADAGALREAAGRTWQGLAGEEGVADLVGELVSALAGRAPLGELHDRLAGVASDLADVAREARNLAETLEDDPERLEAVLTRRQVLTDLRRKYGETLADVIAFRDAARGRLDELESHDARAEELEARLAVARSALAAAAEGVWRARRAAAPQLGTEVAGHLHRLAMPRATFEVEVGEEPPGDAVTWMLGANPGEPLLPLAKVASGGELARTMLAARLAALRTGRPNDPDGPGSSHTLVFDEVDAGIGGEAAVAVGQALAELAAEHQVLVVTHLPQVAAFADDHLAVHKETAGGRTTASVVKVDGEARIVEVSRMLSGSPRSETARRHAEELLDLGSPRKRRSLR